MVFNIITLFPEMLLGPFDQSIIKRARDKNLIEINLINLRDFAVDTRGSVDDRPYGGGVGMVLRIEPIYKALQKVKNRFPNTKVILTDARGKKFTQKLAFAYSKLENVTVICGHYEGVDERVKKYLVDDSISIGEYVLTGGEIPSMVLVDAVSRLIPGVLEKPEAVQLESFTPGRSVWEHPQYTRPEEFNGWKVPEILLSGNHGQIKKWREEN